MKQALSHDIVTYITYITYIGNHFSGTDLSRLNLTSLDVRFWRLKSVPALDPITFMLISNPKKPFGLLIDIKIMSEL